MRARQFVGPVCPRGHPVKKVKSEPGFYRLQGRLEVFIGARGFIEIAENNPAFAFRMFKPCLDNLSNRASFGLPHNACPFLIGVGRFEMAREQRDGLEFQLQAVASKYRMVPQFCWYVCKPKIGPCQACVASDMDWLSAGQGGDVQASPIISFETISVRVIGCAGFAKKPIVKEVQRRKIEDLLQGDNVRLGTRNDLCRFDPVGPGKISGT